MGRAFALVLTVLALIAATPQPHPHVRVTPHSDPLYTAFLKRRDDRLGGWLPRVDDLVEPSRRHLATLGPREDALLPMLAADSGLTRFWYAAHGAPSVWAQYDARRRTVRYTSSCCGHQEEVVAWTMRPPPHALAAADVAAVRTLHGARLGMTPRAIEALYGKARLHRSTLRAPYDVLSYAHAIPGHPGCGEVQNFGFAHGALVAIQVGRSC